MTIVFNLILFVCELDDAFERGFDVVLFAVERGGNESKEVSSVKVDGI